MAGQQEEAAAAVSSFDDAPAKDKAAGLGASADSPLLDFEQDAKEHKKAATWCYGTAGIVVSLLLSLIIVCIVLPKTRLGTDLNGARRTHYIAAEYVDWTYVPTGINQCHSDGFMGPGMDANATLEGSTVVGTARKATFRAYTDRSFTTPLPVDDRWAHLGIIGPVIYAEAGDTIDVVFNNKLDFPVNLEPSGQAWNLPNLLPSIVPTRIVVYTWQVPMSAAPGPKDEQSSRLYLYRSTINPARHENVGLAGPLIVTRKGDANPDGSAKGVDRDIVTVFQVYNENETPFTNLNMANASFNTTELFRKVINGYSWCSVPKLDMVAGERVRWHIAAMGSEEGLHNFHWHGNILMRNYRAADQFQAVPGSTLSADIIPDNPGTWMFHCHVNEHLDGGMVALYNVRLPAANSNLPTPLITKPYEEVRKVLGGVERKHYIMATEVEWDYTPMGGDACGPSFDGPTAPELAPFEEGPLAGPGNGTLSLGRKVLKTVYIEYEDANFTTPLVRGPEDAYLGLVGPVLRAHVGDTLLVTLRNNVTSHPVTLHPHGVLYTKAGEGAPYNDGTTGDDKRDDAVAPGEEWTYVWHVPERAGPGPSDPSSTMWMYHSHTDETADTFAGLFGAIIVYPRKAGSPEGPITPPEDVEREVVLFFSNMEEGASLYKMVNAEALLGDEAASRNMTIEEVVADEAFMLDNQRSSVNGYMYCNMPGLSLRAGSRVRFHFMALGAQMDMHSPLIDGASSFGLGVGQHVSKIQMSAGSMMSRDMTVAREGTWRISCGVQDHMSMRATYQVTPGADASVAPPKGPERIWYVAAEQVAWDYAPNYNGSVPACTGLDFSPISATYLAKQEGVSIGHRNLKAMYVLYEDAAFTKRAPQPVWHGIQGPLLAAEAGDTLTVVFKNDVPGMTLNLRPIAPLLALTEDGSYENSQGAGAFAPAIETGEKITYRWYVPEGAAPTANDTTNTFAYGYSSSVDVTGDENAGLVGGLVLACKGCLKWTDPLKPVPVGVDVMEPVLWQVFDENLSPYLLANMAAAGIDTATTDLEDGDFMETNMKHAVNGWMYCTMPPIVVPQGALVRWVMIDFGGATALHSPYFTSQLMATADGPASTDLMMPGQAITVDMQASKAGTWPIYCQVHDHMEAGMIGSFTITPRTSGGRRLLRSFAA